MPVLSPRYDRFTAPAASNRITGTFRRLSWSTTTKAEQRAVNRLRDDLSSGRWAKRNRDLVALDAAELGLRLLVA